MRIAVIAAITLLSHSAHAQLAQTDRVEAIMADPAGGTMPLLEERLTIAIDGQHATTTLVQVYENRTGSVTEGRYKLRAGYGSHVDGFAYWNGEQKIVGEVFEKQMARQVYDRVTTQRRDPGLLEQEGEGQFGFKISPIAAGEKKRVELRWSQWLERDDKTVRFRAPVTRNDAEIVVTMTGDAKALVSPTHKLHKEKSNGGLRLRSEGAKKSGELILEWQVDAPDWQPTVYVNSAGDHDGWFVASLAAPSVEAKQIAAKDVTIVIDRSGSMTGEAITHARTAAADMIKRLDARDRINVIAFSDEVDPLFAAPQELDADSRARAIAFAERLRPGGGTDIALALKTAINAQDKKHERPRVIVFMTDGQSEPALALEAAKLDNGDARVFTIGLGDVNKPLLQRIAAIKRGHFTYIDQASSIQREVAKLAESIAKPVLVNVSVEVEGANAVRVYPRTTPDLFAHDELLVTGRIRGKGTAKFIFKGLVGGKMMTFTQSVDLAKAPPRPWVGKLWGKHRIDHLLEEIALASKDSAEMKNEVLELALAYNFVTPYTSFLAIPESELGEMRGTVEDARNRKKKIMADNADAAALRDQEKDKQSIGATSTPTATPATQPAPPPSVDVADIDEDGVEGSYDDASDEDDEEEEARSPDSGSPISSSRQVKGRGCAGCATGSGDTASLLVLCIAVLVLRRRRRN